MLTVEYVISKLDTILIFEDETRKLNYEPMTGYFHIFRKSDNILIGWCKNIDEIVEAWNNNWTKKLTI